MDCTSTDCETCECCGPDEGETKLFQGAEPLLIQSRFAAGQVIFYAGHLPLGIWQLTSGTIQLTHANRGTMRIVEAPQTIGVALLTCGKPYCCMATAVSSVVMRFLPRTRFCS